MSQEGTGDLDTFRILVVSDTHIGYLERDPIRGNDSFHTWEEVLKHAVELKVDFILHGGDMFHDNKPSRKTMFRTMEIIRRYAFGDGNIQMNIVSDQAKNFPVFKTVNYEDPNFNISVPMFIIHGNHDDPAGDGQYSALDMLSACNFVNYFGKSANIDDITIYPILLVKGGTKLALYGLGNIRDERLSRTWSQKKVKFMRPVEKAEWFNIFVLHQNRIAHSPKNFIAEGMIEGFMDFVLWGHEHECRIDPTPSSEGDFFICQPGSTIATALSEMEAKEKHIGLLEVCGDKFRLGPIKLKTVRPFIIDDIVLASHEDEIDETDPEQWNAFLATKIEEAIEKALVISKENGTEDLIPIIRLRVDYTGYQTINATRFGQRFVGRVANPGDLLLFSRKKKKGVAVVGKAEEQELLQAALRPDPLDEIAIEDLISGFLGVTGSKGNMDVLFEMDFHTALKNYVEKDEKAAIEDFVNAQISKTQRFLKGQDPEESKTAEGIQKLVTENMLKQRQAKGLDDTQKKLADFVKGEDDDEVKKEAGTQKKASVKRGRKKQDSVESISDDEEFDVPSLTVKKEPKKAKGRKRERDEDDEDDEDLDEPPTKKRKTAAPTPKKAAATKAPAKPKAPAAAKGKSSQKVAVKVSNTPTKKAAPLLFTIDDSSDDEKPPKKTDVSINTSRYGARKTT